MLPMTDSKAQPMSIHEQHKLMHIMYPYVPFVDPDTDRVTRLDDVSRHRHNLVGDDVSHADICLQHWLSNKALWGSHDPKTPVTINNNPSGFGCNCAMALKLTKSNQSDALEGVPEHILDLRRRRLSLFSVSYKNYCTALRVGV